MIPFDSSDYLDQFVCLQIWISQFSYNDIELDLEVMLQNGVTIDLYSEKQSKCTHALRSPH